MCGFAGRRAHRCSSCRCEHRRKGLASAKMSYTRVTSCHSTPPWWPHLSFCPACSLLHFHIPTLCVSVMCSKASNCSGGSSLRAPPCLPPSSSHPPGRLSHNSGRTRKVSRCLHPLPPQQRWQGLWPALSQGRGCSWVGLEGGCTFPEKCWGRKEWGCKGTMLLHLCPAAPTPEAFVLPLKAIIFIPRAQPEDLSPDIWKAVQSFALTARSECCSECKHPLFLEPSTWGVSFTLSLCCTQCIPVG